MNIEISASRIAKLTLWITFGLTVIFLALKAINYFVDHRLVSFATRLFEFRYEGIFQTWFSTLLLLFASLLCLVIALAIYKSKGPFLWYWALLSCVFLFLAMDEALVIHEQFSRVSRIFVQTGIGIFTYAWVIPYGVFTMIFITFFSKFIINIRPEIRVLFVLGIGLFILGALGFEMLGAHYDRHFNKEDLWWFAISSTEEVLEMIGVGIINYSLLRYLNLEFPVLQIRFTL